MNKPFDCPNIDLSLALWLGTIFMIHGGNKMLKRFAGNTLAVAFLLSWTLAAATGKTAAAASEQDVLQADHALVQAIGSADKKALGGLLDSDFTWTDSAGKVLTKA